MAFVKWRRKKPYVYKSTRERPFKAEYDSEGNIRVRTREDQIKSEYLGSYENYRMKRPCGGYERLIKPEKIIKMMANEMWKLDILSGIDKEFERDCYKRQ